MTVKKIGWAVGLSALVLQGCSTVNRSSIPLVDSGAPVARAAGYTAPRQAQQQTVSTAPAAIPANDAVTVMVPQGQPAAIVSTPTGAGLRSSVNSESTSTLSDWGSAPSSATTTPNNSVGNSVYAPTGIPSQQPRQQLAADEMLDGPVLALLTTAQQLQGQGDLNGAASSIERAQRIAPREPQVLYRLAQIRLDQGDAADAEQLARRGLGFAGGRPALQASLWELVAQARERQGDPNGAQQARNNARVNL